MTSLWVLRHSDWSCQLIRKKKSVAWWIVGDIAAASCLLFYPHKWSHKSLWDVICPRFHLVSKVENSELFLDFIENLGKLRFSSWVHCAQCNWCNTDLPLFLTLIYLYCNFFLEFGCFATWPQNNEERGSKLSNQEWSCHSNGWSDVITVDHLHVPLYLGHLWSIFFAINCPVSQATWRLPRHLWWFPWGVLLAPTKHSRGTTHSFTLCRVSFTVDQWYKILSLGHLVLLLNETSLQLGSTALWPESCQIQVLLKPCNNFPYYSPLKCKCDSTLIQFMNFVWHSRN